MGLLTTLAMALAVAAPAGAGAMAFQQLKGLVGEWRGQRPDGREIGVTYRLSARDSVLVETWSLGPGLESLTIYHMDGAELMATHFCPQGNQPRLRMKRAAGSRFDFTFYDATGVKSARQFSTISGSRSARTPRSHAAKPTFRATRRRARRSLTNG